jgi:eukaryotic-like serine/threonine-protein kinase
VARADDERNAALDAETIDGPGLEQRRLDGRFEVRALIARGGMGEVYDGFDLELERVVAIKILAPKHQSDPDLRARFRREASALSKLSHPNIVVVLAVGEGEVPYFVMQRLEGRTLAEHIRISSPLSHVAVIDIGVQLLAALAYLHETGLVHRDVKPSNVMIAPDGHATLLDFGIARDQDSRLTITGATVGTPEYMAPEQARDARLASTRSDLYAAGATLYAAWTGAPPFTGASAYEIVSQHHQREVPRVSSLRADLPAGVDQFLARALAKLPDARFADARAMLVALEDLRAARAQRSKRIAPWIAIAAVVVAGAFWFMSPPEPRQPEPVAAADAAEPRAIVEPAPIVTATITPPDAGQKTKRPAPARAKTFPDASTPIEQPTPPPIEESAVRIVTLENGISTWAEVIIDGEPPRHSPIARWVLPPGNHTLIARRTGFIPKTMRFKLDPGEQKKLEISLEPAP